MHGTTLLLTMTGYCSGDGSVVVAMKIGKMSNLPSTTVIEGQRVSSSTWRTSSSDWSTTPPIVTVADALALARIPFRIFVENKES